jgi:hypothetical protein
MLGPHHEKVTPVHRRQLSQTEAFGDGDQRCVDSAQTEVGVVTNQLVASLPVFCGQVDHLGTFIREQCEKGLPLGQRRIGPR